MNTYFFILLTVFIVNGVAAEAVAGDCAPTEAQFLGTHHKPIDRQAGDIGKGLVVSGRVLSASGCISIAGARIEHWQTDREGVYVNRMRAWLPSDEQGNYRFETEWPGAPVSHIHFIVTAPGHKRLVTQWFGDDPVEEIEFDLVLTPE